ncbi:MAG: YfhO family protein [bacterium]|nr:YfhO family protein [bacterium]
MVQSSRITIRELILHTLLLVVLLAFVFPGTFLRGEMISPGYVLLQMLPWKAHAAIDWPNTENLITWEFVGQFTGWYKQAFEAIAHGEWPLWNPLELTGMPLLANYQTAVFYPPRLLHAFLDHHLASTLFILLKVWLCGVTAYVCGRGIGLSRGPSRFLSVAYMLSMYVMSWPYWCLVDVAAWMPILFLGVESLLLDRPRRGFCLIAFSGTMMLLAGHPETAFTMGLGVGLYFLLRLAADRRWGRRLWAPAGLALGAWVVAILICSVQLMPFAEYMLNSHQYHQRIHEDVATYSLPVSASVLFWVPRFYGISSDGSYWLNFWISNYTTIIFPGIAVWIGMVLLLTRPGEGTPSRRRAVCLLAATAFGILMTFNHPTTALLKQLPLLSSLWHVYHIAFAVFALPLLAALGLQHWFSRPRRLHDLKWTLVPVAAVVALVAWTYLFNRVVLEGEGTAGYVRTQMLIAAAFALLGVAVVIVHAVKPCPRLACAALVVLVAADLLIASRGLRPTTPGDRLYPETELTSYLQTLDPPPRVATTSATIAKGTMQWYGVEQWLGFDGIYPYRVMRFWETLGSDLWNAMEPACSIQYYVHLPELHPFFPRDDRGGFELVKTVDELEVYENTWAYPRAYLVGKALVEPDVDAMFEIMRNAQQQFDPGKLALLEAPLPDWTPDSDLDDLGEARVVERTWTKVSIEVDAKDDALLVLSDQYFPGWRATIDDEPADIVPVYYVFRGVPIRKGAHTVRFEYRPNSFRIGLIVSTITLLIAATLSALALRRRQIPSPSP